MRASRLLSIQMLLETRGRMSARELAQALEVSVRTLHRDIDELSAAGVPVFAGRGRAGGFELMRGWKTTLTGLTPSEAQALFLGGLTGPAQDLGLAQDVRQALLKMLSALPADWRADASRVSSRLYLDPVDWYRDADSLPHLPLVASAVWSGLQLAMRYESWTATRERVVHPLGLVLKAGAWYMVAAKEDEPRTWRVAGMRDVRVLDATVRRPGKFELAEWWRASVRRFESEILRSEATVLATSAGLRALSCLSSAMAKAVSGVEAPTDGRVRVRIPIESTEHATGQLLRLAPEVEVLGPAALRKALVARLRSINSLYGVA